MRRPGPVSIATLRTLLTALLVSSPVVQVWAQAPLTLQDLESATLEDLLNVRITTATRTSEAVRNAPARVRVVTAAQIQRRGYRSVLDLLKDLPDFKVDLGGDPDYPTQLTVDGSHGANMIVLLLDGIRISSPTNEPLPILANYPVHSARQVEIVYGPASALYGADAFSAVVNIISKDVTDAPHFSMSASAGQFGLYNETALYTAQLGSRATLMIAGQQLNDRQPDLSTYYPLDFQGLTGQHSGTFNTIFGPMTPSPPVSPGYKIPLSAQSLQATLRAGGLQLMLFENHSHTPTTPSFTPDNSVYNADTFNGNTLLVASGSYTRPVGRVTSTSTLTFSRHELDPQSGYMNVFSSLQRSYKYAYGSMAKVEEQLSWKAAPSVTMTTGGTFERFFSIPKGADLNAPVASQDAPGTILGTNIPDHFVKLRYANAGVFGQMQYAVTPAVTLTLGARADYNTRYGSTFNPRIGVVVQPTRHTTMKLLYGSAFLAPSPYEGYQHYGSFYSADGGQTFASNYWHLPNPDLKPQLKKTIEINLMQSAGSDFQLSASAFYSRFVNLIQTSNAAQSHAGLYLGWPVAYIDFALNEGHATTYGGTLGLEFLHALGSERHVEAHAALALANGRTWENNGSGLSLPTGAMAPVQVRFGADVDWHRWSVAPRLAIVGSQRLLATVAVGDSIERRTLDGYATVDVNVRRRNLLKNLDAFVTIENGLDRRYRNINVRAYTNPEEMIGAPQNPQRITVGLDLRLP